MIKIVTGDNGPEEVEMTAEEIAQWTAEQIPPEPYNPTETPLTRRQVRAALVLAGYPIDAVPQAIAAIPDPQSRALAIIDWEDAPEYRRDHPLFNSPPLLSALNLNAAKVDAMWAGAVSLPR